MPGVGRAVEQKTGGLVGQKSQQAAGREMKPGERHMQGRLAAQPEQEGGQSVCKEVTELGAAAGR